MKTEPEIRAETTPVADELDLDALESLMAYADPSAPIDHMAIYAALRNAAPALFAAPRERDALGALLDKAEDALEDIRQKLSYAGQDAVPPAVAQCNLNQAYHHCVSILAEIRNAKATT